VNAKPYTTQLGAGLGMFDESQALLRLYQDGDSISALANRAIREGVFAQMTARRIQNLVKEMFAPRFLAGSVPAAKHLKLLLTKNLQSEDWNQIFLIHTARAQTILGDFIREVFWAQYAGGATHLSRQQAELFISRAMDAGITTKRWSETMARRVAEYLMGACSDFSLLDRQARRERRILPFVVRPKVALYLAHDLHFTPVSDASVVTSPDWGLFGLSPHDALAELRRVSQDGRMIVQSGADLVHISWSHRSMEEFCHAIT
jgi:hypothetical protein